MNNLVVGAGFSGAVIANLIATKLNEEVLVIDKKSHIAGNCYDYRDNNNIMIHKYGSHIFHTNSEKVWKFVAQFCDLNQYMHKVYAVIDGIQTTIPFNLNTLYDIFPQKLAQRLEDKLLSNYKYNSKVPILEFQKQDIKEQDDDLKFLADYIYEKVFLNYTKKQWGVKPEDIDSIVTARIPVFISKDNRYFQDIYQGIPIDGYTKLVEKILDFPKIKIELNKDFKEIKDVSSFKRVFYTGAIDEFFDYELGQLPYRSLEFKFEEKDCAFYQKNSVINYPCNYDFTRIHEYKHYLNDKSDKTVIAKEYPKIFKLGENERYYPILNEENTSLYNKYLQKSKQYKNVYFLGRLGDYKYYDMDKAILRAIELFEEIINA